MCYRRITQFVRYYWSCWIIDDSKLAVLQFKAVIVFLLCILTLSVCQFMYVLVAYFPACNIIISKRYTQYWVKTVVGISLKMIVILAADTHSQSPATTWELKENQRLERELFSSPLYLAKRPLTAVVGGRSSVSCMNRSC